MYELKKIQSVQCKKEKKTYTWNEKALMNLRVTIIRVIIFESMQIMKRYG